jgi:hypothetical protein
MQPSLFGIVTVNRSPGLGISSVAAILDGMTAEAEFTELLTGKYQL